VPLAVTPQALARLGKATTVALEVAVLKAAAAAAERALLVAMLLVELLHSNPLVERVVSVWHRPYRVHQPTMLAAVVAQTTIRQAHKVVLAAMAVAGMVTMAQLAQLLERQILVAALVEQAKM
jgi:hypothetical protein